MPDKKDETISWIIDIGLIFLWFPVGLILTISHALGGDLIGKLLHRLRTGSKKSGAAQTRAQTASSAANHRARYTPETEAERRTRERWAQANQARAQSAAHASKSAGPSPAAPQEKNSKAEKAPKSDKSASRDNLLPVFGWILIAVGLVELAANAQAGLWALLSALAVALGGGAMLYASARRKKKKSQYKNFLNVTGTSGVVNIDRVCQTMGMEWKQAEALLSEMVYAGIYGKRAYIDHARRLLVIDPQDMRDIYRAEDEQKQADAQARAAAAATEYDRILAQIRQADVDIEDEIMSEKIRSMEGYTTAIFSEVEAHPEKKQQIRRFMDYYLPTTLKLLNSYARIEKQGVSGENMAKAKADIERIADTLVEGYKNQLDSLYMAEAVDIAGDVSVIEGMLRRDGLAGGNDFHPFAQGTGAAAAAGAVMEESK